MLTPTPGPFPPIGFVLGYLCKTKKENHTVTPFYVFALLVSDSSSSYFFYSRVFFFLLLSKCPRCNTRGHSQPRNFFFSFSFRNFGCGNELNLWLAIYSHHHSSLSPIFHFPLLEVVTSEFVFFFESSRFESMACVFFVNRITVILVAFLFLFVFFRTIFREIA